MIAKAKRGEEDNVLKEHVIALNMIAQGRLVVPIYIASKGQTPDRRDCYIKINTEASLRLIDTEIAANPAAEKLLQVKEVLQQLFNIQQFVHIEPDLISEQVPKIIQMWYKKFVQNSGKKNNDSQRAFAEPGAFTRFYMHPSQSFRLTIVGVAIGLIGILFSLSLLFVPSKSKRHANLKYGVAMGNVIGFFIILLFCVAKSATLLYSSSQIHCISCEDVMLTDTPQVDRYYAKIPYVQYIVDDCNCFPDDDGGIEYDYDFDFYKSRMLTCLNCVCNNIYIQCDQEYALAVALIAMIAMQTLFIFFTVELMRRFIRAESFSLSLN